MKTEPPARKVSRNEFLKILMGVGGTLLASPFLKACRGIGLIPSGDTPAVQAPPEVVPATLTPLPTTAVEPSITAQTGTAHLALVKTRDRAEGIRQALSLLNINPVKGKSVLLKPNLNSADPPPASTHPNTIRTLVETIWEMGASSITLADRSGMGHSRDVMQRLGIFDMAGEMGFDTLSFEDLDEDQWELIQLEGSHWSRGFPIAKAVLSSGAIIQTCCLKPHRFGGHFTLSLKNSVGMVAKFMGSGGHNYMTELHTSFYQRQMIAEINAAYKPSLIVLDGVEAFLDQGPDIGTKVFGDVIIAGTDRIAIDAVGLAALRLLGYRGKASRGGIFEQEQIARAVELGLGVDTVEKIQLVTGDQASQEYAAQITEFLT
jgi:uncharacterized protein (DUF362 family)